MISKYTDLKRKQYFKSETWGSHTGRLTPELLHSGVMLSSPRGGGAQGRVTTVMTAGLQPLIPQAASERVSDAS